MSESSAPRGGVVPRLNLRGQLIFVVFAMIVAVVGFQVMYFPSQHSRATTDALATKAVAVTELLANTINMGIPGLDDKVTLDRVLHGGNDKQLDYIALYDGDNNVIAGWVSNPKDSAGQRTWASRTTTYVRDGVLHVEVPVGERRHLVAGYKMDQITADNRSDLITTLIIGGAVLVVGLLVAVWLGSSVGNRIAATAALTSDVARGRLDLPRIPATSTDEIGLMAVHLNTMLDTLQIIERHVDEVAKGDLTQDIRVQGDLADALNRMFANQRELVMQIANTAAEIAHVASEILSASKDQESGANEQASVVEETLRTMESLLNSANRIAQTSQQVQDDAEQTHNNNRNINERITQLAQHTDRIGEFLEIIRDIANKTELLSLNAALEGTRAGEAGRGFSLVASQMQRLTENVMSAVRDIKQLTADIREATTASVLATEEGTKRASNTASSARQISLIIQQQRSGTEQVTVSMDEISRVIRSSVVASAQVGDAATQLTELSGRLQQLVQRFEFRREAGG